MTGTISDLRPGGFGFIASEACGRPWKLPFRRSVIGDEVFARLRIGLRVSFDQEHLPGDPSRSHAIRLIPLG
jgi:cold shock CspA family protein